MARLEIDRDARAVTISGTARRPDLATSLTCWSPWPSAPAACSRRDQIMEAVRGRELEAFDRSIDVHMGRIRAAIEARCQEPAPHPDRAGRGLCVCQTAGLSPAVKLSNPFAQRLSLRIWLAVVAGMAVLTLAVGWAWRVAVEEGNMAQPAPHGRELLLRSADGQTVMRGYAVREPGPPGEGIDFRIETDNGEKFTLELGPKPPREDRRGERADERGGERRRAVGPPGPPGGPPGGADRAFWLRPPFGFVWMLAIMGLAAALGVYPVIRRLTLRLEALQRSVKKFGEGDLSVRVPETGQDEVADLARQFNAAAARVETLVKSHKSLLANASHELRSPLTRIRMGLELMGGDQPSPAFRAEILQASHVRFAPSCVVGWKCGCGASHGGFGRER